MEITSLESVTRFLSSVKSIQSLFYKLFSRKQPREEEWGTILGSGSCLTPRQDRALSMIRGRRGQPGAARLHRRVSTGGGREQSPGSSYVSSVLAEHTVWLPKECVTWALSRCHRKQHKTEIHHDKRSCRAKLWAPTRWRFLHSFLSNLRAVTLSTVSSSSLPVKHVISLPVIIRKAGTEFNILLVSEIIQRDTQWRETHRHKLCSSQIYLMKGTKTEEEMATHSSVLAWRIPWTEEPGGLQTLGSQESDTT